ncbi:hypothetical protein REC12_15455 [Desulfosporosinus sp. PR]|nr:hypothetical protein [Desulfosporosinus sp. PR]MDQ7094992.1 hypothetical protein [Desulfosporosinus sp. PR]
MTDAMNFLQFSLNGVQPVLLLVVVIGIAIGISHGILQTIKVIR